MLKISKSFYKKKRREYLRVGMKSLTTTIN